jgi:5'-AMP-activated protein kinase regulatory beta subunit
MATGNGKKRVTFALTAPQAQEVYVCGSFNDWDLTKTPLKADGKGGWKALVMLPPGTYEYRLLVDGQWTDDPQADQYVPNPFGTSNCIVQVGTAQ